LALKRRAREARNIVAALRVAEDLPPGSTIVTILCDTGMKYLKTYGAELAAHVSP
jgi:cysteine synthase A